MFNKIKQLFQQAKQENNQKAELKKAKEYYMLIRSGATFIKFITDDLARQENGMNRHERRRFQKEIEEKGILSSELVNFYKQKIDWVLEQIKMRENPPKPVKPVTPTPNVETVKS